MTRTDSGLPVFLEAQFVRTIPSSPGVYFMLGGDRELLYIGKAADLRKRLSSYANLNGRDRRKINLLSRASELLWQEFRTEQEALVREADLIQALKPASNASFTWDDPYTYIRVSKLSRGVSQKVRIEVLPSVGGAVGRLYGSFPHLGKGKYSFPAVRMKAGYPALLRLLFAAHAESPRVILPSRISGKSFPSAFDLRVNDDLLKPINELFAGRSPRLVTQLGERLRTNENIPDFMRRGVENDLSSARDFYLLGPRALRLFKRRHGLTSDPVSQETIDDLLREELRQLIGDFQIRPSS